MNTDFEATGSHLPTIMTMNLFQILSQWKLRSKADLQVVLGWTASQPHGVEFVI